VGKQYVAMQYAQCKTWPGVVSWTWVGSIKRLTWDPSIGV